MVTVSSCLSYSVHEAPLCFSMSKSFFLDMRHQYFTLKFACFVHFRSELLTTVTIGDREIGKDSKYSAQ